MTDAPVPGPAAQSTVMRRRKASPSTAPLWLRNCRQTSRHWLWAGRTMPTSGAAAEVARPASGTRARAGLSDGSRNEASVITDPGVEHPVEDVGDQVEEHDQHREDEGQRLHHG